jgi:hypothetical protein
VVLVLIVVLVRHIRKRRRIAEVLASDNPGTGYGQSDERSGSRRGGWSSLGSQKQDKEDEGSVLEDGPSDPNAHPATTVSAQSGGSTYSPFIKTGNSHTYEPQLASGATLQRQMTTQLNADYRPMAATTQIQRPAPVSKAPSSLSHESGSNYGSSSQYSSDHIIPILDAYGLPSPNLRSATPQKADQQRGHPHHGFVAETGHYSADRSRSDPYEGETETLAYDDPVSNRR